MFESLKLKPHHNKNIVQNKSSFIWHLALVKDHFYFVEMRFVLVRNDPLNLVHEYLLELFIVVTYIPINTNS